MDSFILLFFALYFIAVGAAGNGKNLVANVISDMGGFLPWAVIVGAVAALGANPYTEKLGKPLLFLAFLAFVVKNGNALENGIKAGYDTLEKQFDSMGVPGASSGGNSGTGINLSEPTTIEQDKNSHAADVLEKGIL